MTKLLALVFLTVLLAILEQSALGNDTTYGSYRQKDYYFSETDKLNWFKAFEFCRMRGMFLLSVRNPEEREALIHYMTSMGYDKTHISLMAWTSGNDLGLEGDFHWASTGEHFNWNWRENEPNDDKKDDANGEHCCAMEYFQGSGANFNYTFNDQSCVKEMLFFCESLPVWARV